MIWQGGRWIRRPSFRAAAKAPGVEGVETYIREHRQADFVDNLSRKLLAYALNRSLQLSDEAVIERMKTKLQAEDYRFDALVETIVTSPQFLNTRVPDLRAKRPELQSRR